MYNSKIIGLGKYLPSNVVTNSDLEKIMDTSDKWIQERTGGGLVVSDRVFKYDLG